MGDPLGEASPQEETEIKNPPIYVCHILKFGINFLLVGVQGSFPQKIC